MIGRLSRQPHGAPEMIARSADEPPMRGLLATVRYDDCVPSVSQHSLALSTGLRHPAPEIEVVATGAVLVAGQQPCRRQADSPPSVPGDYRGRARIHLED